MGAGISAFSSSQSEDGGSSSRLKTGLDDVPESCIAAILTHLTPIEICRLAKINRSFRGAASADFVWELKLPNNYRYLVRKLLDGIPEDASKKEIYARLCRPNPFDCGLKEVWLEKTTGGICMSISAKALSITGIEDRRYWNYISTEESRYGQVAYLQQTWWLEVCGEVEFQFPAGIYCIFYRVHLGRASKRLGRRICHCEHVHGWDLKPARFQLTTSDGQRASSQCTLDEPGNWIHYHVGDFVVENSNTPTKVKFSMTQIDCTHTKGGLCVDSVLIYPSGFRESQMFLTQRSLSSL